MPARAYELHCHSEERFVLRVRRTVTRNLHLFFSIVIPPALGNEGNPSRCIGRREAWLPSAGNLHLLFRVPHPSRLPRKVGIWPTVPHLAIPPALRNEGNPVAPSADGGEGPAIELRCARRSKKPVILRSCFAATKNLAPTILSFRASPDAVYRDDAESLHFGVRLVLSAAEGPSASRIPAQPELDAALSV
jgi:hypothetical protein